MEQLIYWWHANIDTLSADSATLTTADINGGTIDGAAIGDNSASTGRFTTVTATSDLTVSGAATFNGNVDLGNASSDTVAFSARIGSDVTPSADSTYALVPLLYDGLIFLLMLLQLLTMFLSVETWKSSVMLTSLEL